MKRRWSSEDLKNKGLKADKYGNFKPTSSIPLANSKEEKKENKKIKNATRVFIDGIWLDSKLEGYMYTLLKNHKFDFTLKHVFVLQEGFKFLDEKIRAVKMIPDFLVRVGDKTILIDTKGNKTEKFKLQIKLLKKYMVDNNCVYPIELPSTQKQCQDLIIKLIGYRSNGK